MVFSSNMQKKIKIYVKRHIQIHAYMRIMNYVVLGNMKNEPWMLLNFLY